MTTTGKSLRVYTLDDLPPEVVAVTFAKTSRVPYSFDEIARELTETDSSRFHEKWVIGYGHSSVAEHAVLSLAIENVSILGAKVVEDNRLSSFTEKSTRYQVMDPGEFYTPPAFEEGEPARVYGEAIAALYSTYGALMPEARRYCDRAYGSPEWKDLGVSPAGKACDAVRGLLPAAATTNIGWTVNARELRHAVVKMASHPLDEVRELARVITATARARVPTLLKYSEASSYLEGWEGRMAAAAGIRVPSRGSHPVEAAGRSAAAEAPGSGAEPDVRLVSYDPDGERVILAALLFRATGRSHDEIAAEVAAYNADRVGVLLNDALSGIGSHEAPVREFESTAYAFEIVCDFGAYRDIQRHRMATQTEQPLSCELGYAIPTDAREAGLAGRMGEALKRAATSWRALASVDPIHAQYVVPLAFRKRFLMRMNLREAYHFVALRSRVQGHESYRRVAWAVRDAIERVHPNLGALIPAERDTVRVEAEAR
jgi:thymidylate synthase ThyX